MPSTSAAQHRWIGWLHSNPEAREHAGLSKAKTDEWLHADKGSPWKGKGIAHRDDGGSVDTSYQGTPTYGITPTAANQNPIAQNTIQTYSNMPTEKLQETLARLGGPASPQGAVVARVLRQKQMSPQQPAQQQPLGQFKRGGGLKRDMGGMMPGMGSGGGGFLHGTTPGRADSVQTSAPGGSYIVPADVVAGLGEGNSLAGAKVMDSILSTGPRGVSLPRGGGGRGAPRPPSPVREAAKGGGITLFPERRAAGGVKGGNETPVLLSHGEYCIAPHHCERLGTLKDGGKIIPEHPEVRQKRGHKLLDAWVVQQRKKQIAKLKALPPPVKS